jgi:hypothetical protein
MAGIAVAVGQRGILFLDEATVRQQVLAKITGGRGGNDRPAKSVTAQQRQIAGMIEMGMGEDDLVDLLRCDRQRRPVAQPQVLVTLEQATVDQQCADCDSAAEISSR